MKVDLLFCASSISVDKLTGKLSVFDILTDITVKNFPAKFETIAIVAVLRREANDPSIVNPVIVGLINNSPAFSHPVLIEFDGFQCNILTIKANGLYVDEPSIVTTHLILNKQTLATYSFYVRLRQD